MKKIFSGFLAFCLVFSIFSTNFITKAEDNAKKIILKVDTSKISNENVDTYLKKVDNTSRDIAIILLERYIYDILDVFSFIATNDQALIQILQDTKPDFIIKIDKFKMPIYRTIDDDIHRKYNQIFSINKADNFLLFENLTLKEIFEKYKNKKNEFIKKISN